MPSATRAHVHVGEIAVEQVGDDRGSPVRNTSSGILRLVAKVVPGQRLLAARRAPA